MADVEPRRKPPRFKVGRPVLHPQLHLERDTDYVACFQEVSRIQVHMDRYGRTLEEELRKAKLCLDMGSFQAAIDAAKSAIDLDYRSIEAHWLNATANLGLALVLLHVWNGGPGEGQHVGDDTRPEDCVEEARTSVKACVRLTERRDEEAVQLLDYLSTVLSARLTGKRLADALATLPDSSGNQ